MLDIKKYQMIDQKASKTKPSNATSKPKTSSGGSFASKFGNAVENALDNEFDEFQ